MTNTKKIHFFIFFLAATLMAIPSIVSATDDEEKEASVEHRSKVANIVQQLTNIANRDGNIGEEVRQIAQEESTTTEKIITKMEKIEARNGFKTFLIGTDYKNIGALRSELVTTANNIDRLKKTIDQADNAETKANLNTQITALEATQAKVETFIKANESKFSLLGWLVRFFNR